MTVGIVRTEWSGTSGGPGLSQMAVYVGGGGTPTSTQAQSAVNAVRTFWSSIASYLPNELTLQVQPNMDTYDELTNTLTGTVTAGTAPATVAGSSSSTYAAGCGLKVDWNTGVVLGGRRVVGRTYIVPIASVCYDNDGTLATTPKDTITTAANTLLTSLSTGGLNMGVWTKPGGVNSVPGITAVTGATVKDKTAILRGRRD